MAYKKSPPYKSPSPGLLLVLSALSLLLCWFYGIVGLGLAGCSLLRLYRGGVRWSFRKKLKQLTAAEWALRLAALGFFFSAFFTYFYLLALVRGTIIKW